MKRRALFRSALALPIVSVCAPLLAERLTETSPEGLALADRLTMVMQMHNTNPPLISWSATQEYLGFTSKFDFSDVLLESLKMEMETA